MYCSFSKFYKNIFREYIFKNMLFTVVFQKTFILKIENCQAIKIFVLYIVYRNFNLLVKKSKTNQSEAIL